LDTSRCFVRQEKGKVLKVDKLPVKSLCESSKKVLNKADEEFKLGI
jgi:hypothetical protein